MARLTTAEAYTRTISGKQVWVAPDKRELVRLRLEGKLSVLQDDLTCHGKAIGLVLRTLGGTIEETTVHGADQAAKRNESARARFQALHLGAAQDLPGVR